VNVAASKHVGVRLGHGGESEPVSGVNGGGPPPLDRGTSDTFWRGRGVLVTGVTGFIGAELAAELLVRGALVRGIDRNWDRAEPLRRERLDRLNCYDSFRPFVSDLRDSDRMGQAARQCEDAVVFHLAARPGVRDPALESVYADNVLGTASLLAALRASPPAQVVFASSSSVYGHVAQLPFSEGAPFGGLASAYARSKLLGEVAVAAFYSDVRCPVTVARLFNVYGARGRPDMAPSIFLQRILNRETLMLAGKGEVERDLTHVDDTVEGLIRLAQHATGAATMTTVNIGTGERTTMRGLLAKLEAAVGRRATVVDGPLGEGELRATQADVGCLQAMTGWRPRIGIEEGVGRFVEWALGRTGLVA